MLMRILLDVAALNFLIGENLCHIELKNLVFRQK